METLFLIPLIYVGLWLVLVALQAVFSYGRTAFPSAQESLNAFSERLHDRSDQAAYELGRRARKREFLKWLRAKIGAEGGGSSVNHEVLEAHRQAPILRRLVEVEIPDATLRCVKVHRLAAGAAGVEFIREIALEPECLAMRERVVDLAEATVEMIGAYTFVLDDDRLLHDLIVLRKSILPICRNCPYLEHPASAAPPLCPSAKAAGVRLEGVNCDERGARKRKR